MADQELCYQLNGEVIQAVMEGFGRSSDAYDDLVAYWAALSIDTASDDDGTLDFVGALVGFPRPLVTSIFFGTNMLALGDATLSPVNNPATGLGDALNPGVGGALDSALPLTTYKMPALWYRQLLKAMAQLKWFGLTLYTVDLLAAWANEVGGGTGYTISTDAYGNVLVTFTTNIDPRPLWLINAVFAKMETIPLVTAQQP